jgi:hypothetical protein
MQAPGYNVSFRPVAVATIAYCLASLLHFAHNGVFLDDYPNLPSAITVVVICWTWLAITSLGVAGWLLIRAHRIGWGLLLLGAYACFGFDGLAHYSVASPTAHTFAMNATIWMEALTASVLLYVVAIRLVQGSTRAAAG